MRMICAVILVALAVSFNILTAETQSAYRPLTGEESERLLDEFLPPTTFDPDLRFAFTLRVLPPFSSATQITIAYSHRSAGVVTVARTVKPWSETTEYMAREDRKAQLSDLKRRFPVKVEKTEIDQQTAHVLLREFWRSVGQLSQFAPENTLRHEGTDLVEVLLDPTLYRVQLQDETNYVIRISVYGPDPGDKEAIPAAKQDPLLKWMLSVCQQYSAEPAKVE